MAVQISGNDITVPRDGTFSRNVSIAGTLTYEDVTNVDSIGLVTARNGIEVGASPGVAASISVDGNMIVSGVTTIGGNIKVGTGVTLSPDGDGFFTGVVTATSYSGIDLGAVTGATGDFSIADKIVHTGDTDTAIRFPSADTFTVETAGSERLRTDSSGRIVIGNDGTSFGNAAVQSFIAHGNTAGESAFTAVDTTSVAAGVGGEIAFHGKYNTGAQDYAYLGHIRGIKENATAGNTACALSFHTRPNATAPQERVRITSGGSVLIGRTSATNYDNLLQTKSITVETDGDTTGMAFNRTDSNSAWVAMRFYIQQNQKGYIQVNVDDVTYSTGSDYRLKENAVSISDGITRLKQLKPYRFNWKSNPSGDKVDGFFAHEVSDIVPQAVSGEKDAVDKDGNPDHQVIDHSKLVPLLTAALQEAVTEIESLKARLDAAGL